MKLVTVEFSPITQELDNWVKGNEHFDPRVVDYIHTTKIMKARTQEKTIMYLAVQQPVLLGPFAANPEATPHEIAVAMREAVVGVQMITPLNKIWVPTQDPGIQRILEKLDFTKLPASDFFEKETFYRG